MTFGRIHGEPIKFAYSFATDRAIFFENFCYGVHSKLVTAIFSVSGLKKECEQKCFKNRSKIFLFNKKQPVKSTKFIQKICLQSIKLYQGTL